MNSLKATIECPVSLEPLVNACLTQCGHSFNESDCVTLFGNMLNKACQNQNVPCPVCRTVVTSYAPNFALRDLAERIQSLAKIEEPNANNLEGPLNINRPPEKSPEVTVVCQAKAPNYPGIAARFTHKIVNWPRENGAIIRRQLGFKSANADALIQGFHLLGDFDGSILLRIEFQKHHKAFGDYLRYHGIEIASTDIAAGHSYVRTLSEVKKLYDIVCNNNYFDGVCLSIMSPIIEIGRNV